LRAGKKQQRTKVRLLKTKRENAQTLLFGVDQNDSEEAEEEGKE